MTGLPTHLTALGDALERAVTADLVSDSRRSPHRRVSRRVVLALVAAAVAVPGIAIGAEQLISTSAVATSMPAGTLFLAGTNPSCTVVTQDVEYHCLLQSSPAPELSDFKGTVEPTVDATKHVNGGCRSLRSDGLEWECYIGQAAVDQKIVGEELLGQLSPEPGVG